MKISLSRVSLSGKIKQVRNFLPMLSLDFGEMGRHVKRVSRLAKKIKDIKAAGPLKLLRETLSSALQIGRHVNL